MVKLVQNPSLSANEDADKQRAAGQYPAVFYLKEVASARNKFLRLLPLSNKTRRARTRCLHLREERGITHLRAGVARLIVFYFQW